MTGAEFDLMILHLVRCPGVLERALSANLTADDFQGMQLQPYGVAYRVASDFHHASREAPSLPFLYTEGCKIIDAMPGYTGNLLSQYESLLRMIQQIPDENLRPEYVVRGGMLQRMVDELKLVPAVRAAADATRGGGLVQAVSDVQERYLTSRVAPSTHVDLFDEENMKKFTEDAVQRPWGIDFIDVMTGGMRPKCMVGFLAEVGGGKTIFGVQATCESILRHRNTVFCPFEQAPEGDLAERFYGYMAGVERKELMGGFTRYSDSMRERLSKARDIARKYLRFMPMSDEPGLDGVRGIEAMLTGHVAAGWRPEMLVIDWLGPLVEKWFPEQRKGESAKDLRQKFNSALNLFKELRDRHNLNILILHQIALAHMSGKSPTYIPDQTVAAECKSFPNFFDYVVCLGRRDTVSDCLYCNLAKARGAPLGHRVIQMDAQRNRFVDMGDTMVENPAAGRSKQEPYFVKKEAWQD